MTPDEILKGLYDETLVGNGPAVLDLTNQGLAGGMNPEPGAVAEPVLFSVPAVIAAHRAGGAPPQLPFLG